MSTPNPPEPGVSDSSTPSISAAAHAYQVAMQQTAAKTSTASPVPQIQNSTKDVVMGDDSSETAASPAIVPSSTNAPSPIPPRTGTPNRHTNGTDAHSRATSQHPDPGSSMPSEAPLHGAPTRQYLNSKVTGVLLEGMKQLAKEQPKDPLRVLGEYLLQRSKELEGN
ncbi:hypothetical protein F5884DRAFT_162457 [Xylogone sp. PMI_703]|nr:hypothetical protein F5884DRAFT_162457 [Xylogone sp. PMI_703]